MRRAYYVTVYKTNRTHGPFLDKGKAEAYAKEKHGAVSTMSCFEITTTRSRIYAP